jgi:hypothetical protein
MCTSSCACRLGSAADRTILRDSIEVFLQHHVSVSSLAASFASSGGFETSVLQARLKAAKRALASVTAGAEEDVFG